MLVWLRALHVLFLTRPDMYVINRRVATYVDRILRGARAGDLPIEIPTRLNLGINRKAAQQIGLKLPQSLVLRADALLD